ncbi:hypothetical protein EPUS_07674 [Endocarpon pusillum Z07020]|uniref:Uncharacterized protein n=1 Tax=Endocarpon pusillum (strain Z07020 / HMAS-L-300199) TaxID=1263415 RepID=U1GXB6_ENDPU|nr:uncharacterized protein EPUS_07674 [Endocarpon pusillum Z07020]ERF77133.1 hypothetical protein EPUS_07674 [Endocarpon pusillum Z07020]
MAVPPKPISKPSTIVAGRPPRDKATVRPTTDTESLFRRELGLRSELDRAPNPVQTGIYKDIQVNLHRAQKARALQELRHQGSNAVADTAKYVRGIGASEQRIRNKDKVDRNLLADRGGRHQLLLRKTEQTNHDYNSKAPQAIADNHDQVARANWDLLPEIKRASGDVSRSLVAVTTELSRLLQWSCQRLDEEMRILKPKVLEEAETRRVMKAKKEDSEHAEAFSQREARREAWWAHIEDTVILENDKVRTLADICSGLSLLHSSYKSLYEKLSKSLSWYYYSDSSTSRAKELRSLFYATLMNMIEGNRYLILEAHFLRYYQRNRYYDCEPGAFSHRVRHASLYRVARMFKISAEILRLYAVSWTHIFPRRRISRLELPDAVYENRPVDLSFIIQKNAAVSTKLTRQFSFGLLSNDHDPAIQVRRAQAAALMPFHVVIGGMNSLINEFYSKNETIDPGKYEQRLGFETRQLRLLVDLFTICNWRSLQHRVSTRTIFLKPSSQSDALFSPIQFGVPLGYPRSRSWNYNDYRGPQGEKVTVFCARESTSMESCLAQLQHEGVVSVDVRWAPDREKSSDALHDWFGHNVSVVTLATESQIVVCHLALLTRYLSIPVSLRLLLEDPNIIKVAINIDELQTRFEKYLGIHMTGTCNLTSLDASFHSTLLEGAPHHGIRTIADLVKKHFNMELCGLRQSTKIWLYSFSLRELQCVCSGAYACLRLFFHLSEKMFDRKTEQLIPLNGCSGRTVQNLALLFPAATRGINKISSERVEPSATEKTHQHATSVIQLPYEETGTIKVSRQRIGYQDLVGKWAAQLARELIKTRRSSNFQQSSLRLYYLWHTFELQCDDIDIYFPQPHANVPAAILEVIESAGLPYHPESFKTLQKMALVQFYAGQKIWLLEEAWMHSWMQDLSPADLSQRISDLMAVIHGKRTAENWIDVAARSYHSQTTQNPHQDLLPFAMWHIGDVSVHNISNLLLRSRSSIAESILNEVLQSKSRAGSMQLGLEDIAEMTGDPPLWMKRLNLMSKRD